MDLESLYGKYVDYVTCLHAELDRVAGVPVSPEYRAPLLSCDDFCRTWQQWGNTKGLQEVWRQRFELGYHQAAADLRARLEAAITGTSCRGSIPNPRRAA